ncbi:MAG: hypothetical protein M1834_000571 [Cirrosporium novae-zelandiae]|nr:MAG: hypothetical protein M1834_000571 [Cirrosporium novae-zelandiae]
MAYTDDAVKGKLSALNETQDSIVTTAQWLIFHRRHADRTAQIWSTRLRDSGANKRLNLIYLANEIVQQCKARKRDEFLTAFSPIIADATSSAYKGATNDVQTKLKRVVEVWRQRQIFELPIQEAVEKRISDLDKSRSSGKRGFLSGGSLFSDAASSTPSELQPLVPLQVSCNKAAGNALTVVPTADADYDKMVDPSTTLPSPPVHAARLSALLKLLANAEGAVAEGIKARKALVEGLEKVLETNKTALAKEETQAEELAHRKTVIETMKRNVEDAIMRGLSAESTPNNDHGGSHTPPGLPHDSPVQELERPDVEELTPPPVESLTPIGSPSAFMSTGADLVHEQQLNHNELPLPIQPPLIPAGAPADLLSSLSMPPVHHSNPLSLSNGYSNKKRKIEEGDAYAGFVAGEDAMEGIDADVAELLRQESRGR